MKGESSMDKEKAIAGLKIALQTELNGIQFYKIAAEKTTDKRGKEVFKMLADDELKHFNELQKHYNSMKTSNKWAPSISLEEAHSIFKGESPIFSDDLKTRINEKHFEMSALSIGALLESSSIDFYRRMKEETNDRIAKELFAKLQIWEEGHLEAITKQLDLLKEEYWTDQHFTPLF
jgi:rubrerythrin